MTKPNPDLSEEELRELIAQARPESEERFVSVLRKIASFINGRRIHDK